MSLPLGYSPTGVQPNSTIQLRRKVSNRFYEPIVFLVCLNMALKHNQISKAPDLSSEVEQSAERAFHCFVNKLGQLCDSQRGGNTVTAFAILQLPDVIQYRFASNQRQEKDLICVQEFVYYILQTLGKANGDELQDKTSHILRKSLSFNRPRVEIYVRSLKKHAVLCIETCAGETTDESNSILENLEKLRGLLCFLGDTKLDNDAFSEHCESLINAIDLLYLSKTAELIRNRTNEGRINESERWCELRHAAGRLLSYLQTAKVLVSTRKRWPELFEDFEVCFIASSLPAQCPLRNRNKAERLTMCDIIGRMTFNPIEMDTYKACALELKKFGLDESIQELASRRPFRPIIHAEVLLLESLVRDCGTHPSQFFKNYRYIGCSKPTCRLCDYYFSFHASGVEVRPTHRNLYSNWRTPDVYEDQGPNAEIERERLMDKILSRIRQDTFRTLTEKVPERKPHDSNTEPTYPIDSILRRELEDMDNLAVGLKKLAIGISEKATPHSSPRMSLDTGDTFEVESDSDGDDGGAKL